MQATLLEALAELFGVAAYAVVAGVLTVGGALVEQASVQAFTTGHTTLGLWEAGVGLLLLYVGVSVLREFVLPDVRERLA